jgi:hypothetical protein
MTKPNCQHAPDPLAPPLSYDYRAWHADADRRVAKKEEQRWCPVCKGWIWEHLWRGKK